MNGRTLNVAFVGAVLLLVAALCRPESACAVSTVAISSGGDGVFTVQGIGIEGAAAFEINVGYDTATLANPRVSSGALVSGAMTAVNTNVPGAVRLVLIRLAAVSGSGVIATLTFDRRGTSPGKITSLTAKLVNSQGARLPSMVQVQNPPEGPATASADSESRQATSDAAGTPAAPTPPGQTVQPGPQTVIIGGAAERPAEGKTVPEAGAKPGGQELVPPEPAREEQPPVVMGKREELPAGGDERARAAASSRKMYQQKSVLEVFRDYRGERTPQAFVSLFAQEGNVWCRQDPPVALSDGRTAIRVMFITTPGRKTSSDIAVMGARLVSLKQDPDNTNTWIAELIPLKGEYRGSVAVAQGDVTMVCALTVAPPITLGASRSGPAAKAAPDRSGRGQGTAAQATSDVNGDGKVDYIDDYIVTANYLAAAGKALRAE